MRQSLLRRLQASAVRRDRPEFGGGAAEPSPASRAGDRSIPAKLPVSLGRIRLQLAVKPGRRKPPG